MSSTERLSTTVIGVGLILFTGACSMADRMDKSRMQAEEIAAIQTVKIIQNAQVQYFSQYGKYANSIAQLGPVASGPPTAQAADLVPPDLAGGVKGGYKFTLEGDGQKFDIQARPVTYGKTGNRSFYSDASLLIRQNSEDAPATPESPELK